MGENIHKINRQIATALASCSWIIVCLLILKSLHIFNFEGVLGVLIPVVGFSTLLSPIILYKLKVPDNFLKYYMSFAMAIFIGTLGCFNGIGIYITFILVPVASCLYIDKNYTIKCSILSYIVMVIAVYFNSAGKYEIRFLGWSHLFTFRAYIIGFTLEYIVVAIFLALIMKRARDLVEEQHQAYLAIKEQDIRLSLMVKGTRDVIFEYYPQENRYTANRSLFQKADEKNKPVVIENFDSVLSKYPGMNVLHERLVQGFKNNDYDIFEVDMSYENEGEIIPLWYNIESFAVLDGDVPVSVIGKMHDITRIKINQDNLAKQQLESICQDSKRKNSLYEQIMKESVNFVEADFEKLADGHRMLAHIMEDIKYSEDLVQGIDIMLSHMGKYFGLDRICVIETDMSSGACSVNYQWSRKPEDYLKDYFTTMSTKEIQVTTSIYDLNGYIEVNPSEGIIVKDEYEGDFLEEVIYSIILGNQLWVPMVENGKYIGACCVDRYDTKLYTSVEKFLISEAVNTLTNLILKVNAENANKAKSDFLSTMSHEIRTPMNAIVGMTEVALREDMSENVKKNLKMVQSSAFGLLTLINDILDYSKIEAGRFDIVPEKFSILSILNDVKEIAIARNNGKLELEFDVPEDIPTKLYGDSVRIKQVMINFCTNAIKYSDKGNVWIKVLVQKKDDLNCNFEFSVKDTGIGIKKEDLSKLFKSYTRVDTTVNHHKEGTGLGLAISKQLVELMDGFVSVESEYGVGSTFSFSIPLGVEDWTPAGKLEDFTYEENNAEIVDYSFTAPDARILIVDDNEINLLVAKALLEPTLMQIDTANSGAEAIKLISNNDYNIVFMDHFMPEMDGVEATKRIRNLEDLSKSQVPIIALTADAMEGVKEEMLRKGMNDFLTKPIMINDMYQILRRWVPENLIKE